MEKPSISHLCCTMDLLRQLPTFFLVYMSDEVVKTAKVITENSGADMSEVSSACFIAIISFNLNPNSLWFLENLSSIFRDLIYNSVSH